MPLKFDCFTAVVELATPGTKHRDVVRDAIGRLESGQHRGVSRIEAHKEQRAVRRNGCVRRKIEIHTAAQSPLVRRIRGVK